MFVDPRDWKPTPGIALEQTALDVVRSAHSLSVLAGPGAGKTELLAQRAAYLLNTGTCPPPKRILAISFKVDAATNLKNRVEQRCDASTARRFESLTLHGFAKRTLDQFREALAEEYRPSADYRIIFPNRDTWSAFQQRHGGNLPAVRTFNGTQLNSLVHEQLPDFSNPPQTDREAIRRIWWEENLRTRQSALTFDMVMLLANMIIVSQPIVRNAITATYTHVFLDEFQDVTGQQYQLIKSLFVGTSAVVTAVGDTKQAIMGWAGALPKIFEDFGADFDAPNQHLQVNFRSNSKIVELINALGPLFSEELGQTACARANDPAPADALGGWVFRDRDTEGAHLATFVDNSLKADQTLHPHDFVILARLNIDKVEQRLAPFFRAQGLRLRNEARSLGPVAIQEIVKEPIFIFMTSILKMVHGVRIGRPFQVCRDIITALEGLDISTERGSTTSLRSVQALVASVTEISKGQNPSEVSSEAIVQVVFPPLRQAQFSRAYREYENPEYLIELVRAAAAYYEECAQSASAWGELIDVLEGHGAVKLMTIHKSKGLEYHTVIFVELNDDAFWKNSDDVNVFFVALSRARERIRFSLTRDSKGFANVMPFLEKLQEAGVAFENVE